ncbi:MAG TPA: VOC family protein [Xanthobacteraceae bacterium]|jgi:predicted 3-demethylubiquinone-9 3-methyltransferase (glyoxalase superfamily)|nr:VOC family protein [Xanthobacteraceae bacterium]
MSIIKQKIAPCLWFDTGAEDAAKLYVSVFPNSKINAAACVYAAEPRAATECANRGHDERFAVDHPTGPKTNVTNGTL